MLNQVVVVGRIVRDPELNQTENGKKVSNITLAVPRNYKNADGVYETDFIDATLWTNIAENTCEYCKQGDMVGIKGRLQVRQYEDKDGKKKKDLENILFKDYDLAFNSVKNKIYTFYKSPKIQLRIKQV